MFGMSYSEIKVEKFENSQRFTDYYGIYERYYK